MKQIEVLVENILKTASDRYLGFGVWLINRAGSMPDHKAYGFLNNSLGSEQSISYFHLLFRAVRIAARIQNMCEPGDRVLLLFPPGLAYVEALFGCFLSGAIAVPVNPPLSKRSAPRLRGIIEDCRPELVLTNADIWNRMEEVDAQMPYLRSMKWLRVEDMDDVDVETWAPPALTPQAIAFLQYTSGSTGTPKGAMVNHGNLEHNSRAIFEKFGHHAESRGLIWLPSYHDMGLIGGILQPIYGGFPVTLMSPLAFVQRPCRWLEAVSKTGATTSGGPNFAYDLCVQNVDSSDIEELDLTSWEVAFCGAEPIRPSVLAAFAEKFAPAGFNQNAFLPCYGLAEGTLMVTGARKGAPLRVQAIEESQPTTDVDRTLVSCGKVIADTELRIVDVEQDRSAPEGEIGEIWVSGPSVVEGYWSNFDQNDKTFDAELSDASSDKRWLRTGDYGFLEQGELFVTGRLKDLIIVAGRNVHPHDIEWIVAYAHPGIRPQGVAAFGLDGEATETFVVAAEEARTRRWPALELQNAVRRALWEKLELVPHDVWLLPPTGIPRTSSGKIQRFEVRRRYLESGIQAAVQAIP
jgi:acyl-CoA synthetase (AMP-forming)/AMP-acid ligase II